MTTYILYDTETTGLPIHKDGPLKDQPRIIEFAAIKYRNGVIIDELEFICNPGHAIDEIITKITGLTNADLDDKPPFSEFVQSIKEFFAYSDVIVAHNLSFDKWMLKFDLARLGLDLTAVDYPTRELCTVEQTFPIYGRMMKLNELYNMHCGEYEQKHRAMSDVVQLAYICEKLGIFNIY